MSTKIAILLISLLLSSNSHAMDLNKIEIFSLTGEKVIKVIPSNPQIQCLALRYLENINGVYSKINPIPDSGYAVKIPLDPPAAIQGKWLNCFVDQIIVMYSDNEPAFLIVFENEKLICFTFSLSADTLRSLILKRAGCLSPPRYGEISN
jgi:hypothetical protein